MPVTCPSCRFDNPEGMKFCGECGARLVTAPAERSESRKLVTILFADVTGSTALGERLDPEALRTLMGRYFATMRRIIESHGGTVEKFIGDAVMAVFGIPQLHEDDALRACRAALEIRAALAALNAELEADRGFGIRFRTGITTGEVVVGDPASGTTLVTGDTVNTAARLEQAAPPGEVLIGPLTHRLVRDAVVVQAVDLVIAKGKAEPVPAVRLVDIIRHAEGRRRQLDTPLVGRARELDRLDQAFRDVTEDDTAALFTVLGSAGIGKTRLTREFLERVGDRASVLRGRCLNYGEGITYWPVGEIVRAAAAIADEDTAADARAKLRALIGEAADADEISGTVASVMGLAADTVPQDDVFWAVRRLFERLAEPRPLVIVIEDLHWAEATLLDLIEEVVDGSRDVPLLVLCTARPDLIEIRPAWGGGKRNATIVYLEPLASGVTEELIRVLPAGAALPAGVVDRIVSAADGNALFVEELVAMLVDDQVLIPGDDGWRMVAPVDDVRIPPSIGLLLAARLDQLRESERAVAQRASVIGREFERRAVAELTPEAGREGVAGALDGLVRKDLIRPDRDDRRGAFSFRHVLIRDAAYERLSKTDRARLHERFADWVEATVGERAPEVEDIVGWHLEQAHRYRRELDETGDALVALGERAGRSLSRSGERAFHQDRSAAANLLMRGRALLRDPADRTRVGQLLCRCLFEEERFDELMTLGADVVAEGTASGAFVDVAQASLAVLGAREALGTVTRAELWDTVAGAQATFEAAGDEPGLARTAMIRSFLHSRDGDEGASIEAALEAKGHAEAAGDAVTVAMAITNVADSYAFGDRPTHEAIPEVEASLESTKVSAGSYFISAGSLAILCAMAGDHDRARRLLVERDRFVSDRGRTRDLANRHPDALTALMSPDPSFAIETVEREYRRRLEARDVRVGRAHGALLGELRLAQGDLAAASAIVEELMDRGETIDAADDAWLTILRAGVASRHGDNAAAIALGREAVEALEGTDGLINHALAWVRLAEVATHAGDVVTAVDAARHAIDVAERKGAVVLQHRAQALLAEATEASEAIPKPWPRPPAAT